MRRLLAGLVALAIAAPAPSFAANVRAAIEPVRPISLPTTPAAATLNAGLPALTNLPAITALPAAATSATPKVVAFPASSNVASAAKAAKGPAQVVAFPVAARTQAQQLGREIAEGRGEAALSVSFDKSAPAKSDSIYAVSGSESKSAPRLSPFAKISRAAAAVAVAITPMAAHAIPDGPGPWDARNVPVASADGLLIGVAIIAAVIAVGSFIGWMIHRHNKKSEERWQDAAREPNEFSSEDMPIGTYTGGVGTPGIPANAKEKIRRGPDGEILPPLSPMFDDVAGQDEAKTELAEVVDFLKNPEAYKKLHPRYKGPKGVLMFGPPGTGKTLLARAVANEADVPFVHRAGSDFINTYVGVGANNVRAAFEEVRKKVKKGGAGILFIDEIEAIGGARTGNTDRSEETRTINALLKEMDGFEKDNIIVIAATNMPESLDPALVRGGRFGTKVPVGLPDVVGREKIFEIHLKGAALAEDVSALSLAKQTPGLAGADIEQIVMDGVKLAKRRGADKIAQQDLVKAIDEFTTGKQRNLVMSKREKEIVAFHESGHALVSHLLPDADPVRKVTIIPHGLNALGFMQAMPEEEKVLYSYEWLVDRIAVALGGRVAEKMMTGRVYSGAQNDLQQATRLAKHMVMQFGMSEEIGHVSYDVEGARPAVGGPMSEETRKKIDAEVKRIIEDALKRVEALLGANRRALEMMAAELMEKETLRSEDMERIIAASHSGPDAPPAPPADTTPKP